MKNFISIILLAFIITSCEKEELRSLDTIVPEGKAYTKFALLSPNTGTVMLKQNGVKINSLTSGSVGFFPVPVNNSPDYAAVDPNTSIQFSLPFLGTGNDSVVVFNAPTALTPNTYNTFVLADTGVDRTVFSFVDQQTPIPADSFYNIRLINAMPKSPAVTLLRIDSTNATSVLRDTIITALPYKAASSFINVPVVGKRVVPTAAPIHGFVRYRLINSLTGATIGQITPNQTVTGITGIGKRNVTVHASGFATGTGTLAPFFGPLIYNK
jgi:hypothetical protein